MKKSEIDYNLKTCALVIRSMSLGLAISILVMLK